MILVVAALVEGGAGPGGARAGGSRAGAEGPAEAASRRSLLLARRAKGLSHGGLWELPGGKVEEGEGPEEALLRELREELGVGARLHGELCRYETRVEGKDFGFIVFRASLETGPLRLAAHDGLCFFEAHEIPGLELAPLDLPALRLWAETPLRATSS